MAHRYVVKELFYSLQGEGAHTGRPAVFLRFAGCNLWSGREQDRLTAQCSFCDTDFVGGQAFGDADHLAKTVRELWPVQDGYAYVVCTGGEPALQLDAALVDALHRQNCLVAVESNGTLALPDGVDWVCISPKSGTSLQVRRGDELKLVWPQDGLDPQNYAGLSFQHFFLQPKDGPNGAVNVQRCIEYCRTYPDWRLSLQTHKIIGIP